MNLRGIRAPAPPSALKLNVTSAQSKTSSSRLDFSPMTPISGGYEGYWNFEHYWQSGKVFEGIDQEITKKWWREQTKPHRRYPNSKGAKVLYAVFDDYQGEQMDYITSRKKVYVPEYFALIKNKNSINGWRRHIERGGDVVVYDFDGPRGVSDRNSLGFKDPRDLDGAPICMPVTLNLLKEKINDPTYPFGHGYIVAGYIAGFEPQHYIDHGTDPARVNSLRDMCMFLFEQINTTADVSRQLHNHIANLCDVNNLNKLVSKLTKWAYFGETFELKNI